MAIEHTQQHSSCLQARRCTSTVFYWRVRRQVIALETHHGRQILAIKFRHLQSQNIRLKKLKWQAQKE